MSTDEVRLRRELRAMAAVNRQLYAQLEEPGSVARPRRTSDGNQWVEQLLANGLTEPHLVREQGRVFVLEGQQRRAVGAGIVAAALEVQLGWAREISAEELSAFADGPPVELFEAPVGPPFVVIGGRRHRVRGIPLPYPVTNRQASAFPEGPDLDIARANVSHRRFREAQGLRAQAGRAKAAVREKGLVRSMKSAGRRLRELVR